MSQPPSMDPGLVMVDGDQMAGGPPGPGVDLQQPPAAGPVSFPGQHEATQVNFANEVGGILYFCYTLVNFTFL